MITPDHTNRTQPKRRAWQTPKVIRIDAGAAENGIMPSRTDGQFSMGS